MLVAEAASPVLFIGLGNMGRPMSAAAHAAGFDVRGADPSATARHGAAQTGMQVAADPLDVLDGVVTVVLVLPTSDVVEAVVNTLVDHLSAGALVIDMGSSDPMRTRALAEQLRASGLRMIDAPVSGGVKGAVEARLTIMVGGDANDVAEAEPLLRSMGTTTHTGPVGSGHALKALNNLLSAMSMLASSEAIQAGRRFGLSDEVMLDVINSSSGRSFSTQFKWPTFIVPETYDSGFTAGLLVKDMRIALALTDQVGLPARLGASALNLWEQAVDELGPGADHTEIARFAAQEWA